MSQFPGNYEGEISYMGDGFTSTACVYFFELDGEVVRAVGADRHTDKPVTAEWSDSLSEWVEITLPDAPRGLPA